MPGELTRVIRRDQPFGPPDSRQIQGLELQAKLFDWHNHAFAELLKGSHLIIGRRGSGKSALIRSYRTRTHLDHNLHSPAGRQFADEYMISLEQLAAVPNIVVDVNTFEEIYEMEKRYQGSNVIPPPEVVTPAWESRIWVLVAREIKRVRPHALPRQINELLSDASHWEAPPLAQSAFAQSIEDCIHNQRLSCMVTFDSGDRYTFDPLQNRIMEGLCRAVSNMIASDRGIDVRVCLPAELFDELRPHFSNPGKDSFRRQYLHWRASELFRIAAHRLKAYLELYNPNEYRKAEGIPIEDRDALWHFWGRYLPPRIQNRMGGEEDTVSYILRHTHLIPRQVLQTLNDIWGQNKTRTAVELFASPISVDDVRRGIATAEVTNRESVVAMYQEVYGNVDRLFEEVMTRLPRICTLSELHQIYNRSGAKHLMAGKIYPDPDFWLFRRLLFSAGALGVVSRHTDVYVEGRFQFNQHVPLSVNENSTVCVHPIFSGTYELPGGSETRAVLPRGSDFRLDE